MEGWLSLKVTDIVITLEPSELRSFCTMEINFATVCISNSKFKKSKILRHIIVSQLAVIAGIILLVTNYVSLTEKSMFLGVV